MNRRLEIFLEFLIFGVLVGIVEDLIAVKIITGEPITWPIFGVVLGVAIPFAFLGEVIVDRKDLAFSTFSKFAKGFSRKRRQGLD